MKCRNTSQQSETLRCNSMEGVVNFLPFKKVFLCFVAAMAISADGFTNENTKNNGYVLLNSVLQNWSGC